MNNLINKLKELEEKELFFYEEFIRGEGYNFAIIGGFIRLQIDNEDKRPLRSFKYIITQVNGGIRSTPSTYELGWKDSLEWLFFHYPYGFNNASNCILIDDDGKIIAIQYNGLKDFSFIKSGNIICPPFIVLNNKWKIEGTFLKEDLKILLPKIKELCAEY